ncbi:hypothetical protein CRM22_004659 [Opisthorchis felineus]|uniref:Apple domain-containing protein n=1 Tax=Opisthorchis felineus TaxID=147828 RepID=A0A4S2M1T9_OPIFE|nr:hypothetical protein CRM22_004659 [Opisthorchis felineus]
MLHLPKLNAPLNVLFYLYCGTMLQNSWCADTEFPSCMHLAPLHVGRRNCSTAYISWIVHKNTIFDAMDSMLDVDVPAACAQMCTITPRCIAFDWQISERACGLVRWPAQPNKRPSKDSTGYSMECCRKQSFSPIRRNCDLIGDLVSFCLFDLIHTSERDDSPFRTCVPPKCASYNFTFPTT